MPKPGGGDPWEEPGSPGPLTAPFVAVGLAESRLFWWGGLLSLPALAARVGTAQKRGCCEGRGSGGCLGGWQDGGEGLDRWSGESHLVGGREMWGGTQLGAGAVCVHPSPLGR